MVADVFSLPVTVQETDEGAALGAALQALWMHDGKASGIELEAFLDSHLALDDSRACAVDGERSEAYAQFYENYLRHVEVISPLYS
jgi:xylulokinase